jgi:hypothetical protein
MPYAVKKTGSTYQVINFDTGHIFAKHATLNKAMSQMKLLHAIEYKAISQKCNSTIKPRTKTKAKSKSKSRTRPRSVPKPKSKTKTKSKSKSRK